MIDDDDISLEERAAQHECYGTPIRWCVWLIAWSLLPFVWLASLVFSGWWLRKD